jgi:hypothetical protein
VTTSGGNPSFTVNLSGITAGAPNESQTLSLSAEASPNMANAISTSRSGTTGTLTMHPGNNTTGSWLITVTVSDGQDSVVRTFVFTAKASGNALPTISNISNQSIPEDGVLASLSFTVGDSQTPAADLVVAAHSTNQTLVPDANIAPGGSGSSRTITVTPAPNQNGTTSIRLTVTDGAFGSSTIAFNLTVTPVNDPPTIQPISNQSTLEDTTTGPIQVFVSDLESAAGALSVTATSGNQSLVPNGNIVVGGSGTNRALIITPAANQAGSAVITVNVSDGGISASTQFTLQVVPVNDAPTISDVADQTIDEDSAAAAIPFTIGDAETVAGNLIVTVDSSNTSLGPLALNLGGSGANRTLNVTPGANIFGVTTITLSVSDGTNQVSDTFVLGVNPVNDPPTLDAIADQTIPLNGAAQAVSVTGISSGASNEMQTLFVAASSSNPSVISNPAINYASPATGGTLSLSTVRGATGSAIITVTVNDGQSQSNTVTRTFTVTILEKGPELRIEFLAGMAVVSWATNNAQGWSLQSTADIMDADGWSAVAAVPVIVNGRHTVTNAPGSAMRAFRLCNSCGPGSPPTPPIVNVSHSGTKVFLSWPVNAGNFVLEETTSLATPINWNATPQRPNAANGWHTVTVDAATRKFYRLRNQ